MTSTNYLIACYYYSTIKTCYFTVRLGVMRGLEWREFAMTINLEFRRYALPSLFIVSGTKQDIRLKRKTDI